MSDWMTFAERVGIPLTILGAFAYAVWKVIQWLGTNVITPITQSHIGVVNEVKENSKTNSETLRKVAELLDRENTTQAANVELLKSLTDKTEKALRVAEESAKVLEKFQNG